MFTKAVTPTGEVGKKPETEECVERGQRMAIRGPSCFVGKGGETSLNQQRRKRDHRKRKRGKKADKKRTPKKARARDTRHSKFYSTRTGG